MAPTAAAAELGVAATGTFTSSCDDLSGVRAPKLVSLLLDEDGDEDGDEDAEGEVGEEGDAGEEGEEGGGDAAEAADAAGLRIIPTTARPAAASLDLGLRRGREVEGCAGGCAGGCVGGCAGGCAGPERIDWRSAAILPDRTGSWGQMRHACVRRRRAFFRSPRRSRIWAWWTKML